jgi:hypothetical protein
VTKDMIEAITILPNGVLEYRRTTRAFDDDGSFIGERHWRTTFIPTTDPATLPAGRLRRVAIAVWTQATIDAYIAAQEPAV